MITMAMKVMIMKMMSAEEEKNKLEEDNKLKLN